MMLTIFLPVIIMMEVIVDHHEIAHKNLLHIFGDFATGIIGIEKLIFSSMAIINLYIIQS